MSEQDTPNMRLRTARETVGDLGTDGPLDTAPSFSTPEPSVTTDPWDAAMDAIRAVARDSRMMLPALEKVYAAREADRQQHQQALDALRAERDRLKDALVKVRAHTAYLPQIGPPVALLAGLLASIERIVDAALTPHTGAAPATGMAQPLRQEPVNLMQVLKDALAQLTSEMPPDAP